jgi:hypothetical protein
MPGIEVEQRDVWLEPVSEAHGLAPSRASPQTSTSLRARLDIQPDQRLVFRDEDATPD